MKAASPPSRRAPRALGRWIPFLAAALISFTATAGAAIPAPGQLLPDDTLIVLSTPDFSKLQALCLKSPKGRLWNDPLMKPFKERFLARWREEVLQPIERDLNLSLGAYGALAQGEVTFAVTRNGWQGTDEQPLGFLVLLDTRDRAGLLKTNLADFRKQWVAAGKPLKTEHIRGLDFSVFPFTTNEVPRSLSRFIWRPLTFAAVSSGPDVKQAPVPPSGKPDMMLDLLTVVLTASKQLVVGQVDSVLVVGNSIPGVEKLVARLTGGAVPVVGDLASYQASYQALFRDASLYGWVNVKTFVEVLGRKPSEAKEADPSDPLEPLRPDKVINSTGLGGCNTLAFALQDTNDGILVQMLIAAPEASRRGFFQILAGAARESGPPPFIPAEAAQFLRWRLDMPHAWTTFEKMLADLSPQALGTLNLILDTASARARLTDPGFDLKQTLLASLGDDIISYQRAPRGNTPAELQAAPSLLLLGSPNPEQLAVALKRLFVIFPQGDAPEEREFLGRKIFSVPLPSLPFLVGGATRTLPARMLSCAASGSYVAMATDSALLEEYLRSSESQAKTLREKTGLLEAAQKVGGLGTGLFTYENDPGASTNGIGPNVFPGLPGITGPEASLKPWMDFSLLPAFDTVAQYFYFSVCAGSANVDGLTLKVFAPTPPALRANPSTTAAK